MLNGCSVQARSKAVLPPDPKEFRFFGARTLPRLVPEGWECSDFAFFFCVCVLSVDPILIFVGRILVGTLVQCDFAWAIMAMILGK